MSFRSFFLIFFSKTRKNLIVLSCLWIISRFQKSKKLMFISNILVLNFISRFSSITIVNVRSLSWIFINRFMIFLDLFKLFNLMIFLCNLILVKFFFRTLTRWSSLNWLFSDFKNSSNIRNVLSNVSWNLNWYNRFVVTVSLIESNAHSFIISAQRSCSKMFVIIRLFLNLIKLLLSIQRPESRLTLFIE